MSNSQVRRPMRLHPNDRAGLLVASLFALLLLFLWFTGHGPWSCVADRRETADQGRQQLAAGTTWWPGRAKNQRTTVAVRRT